MLPSVQGLKRTVVFASFFGVAAALTLAIIIACVNWYEARPQSWDAKSIICLSAKVSPTSTVTQDLKSMKTTGFQFTFVLENTSNHDYTIPEGLDLFVRQHNLSALEHFDGKLDHAFLIPAKERTQIYLNADLSCTTFHISTGAETERDDKTCFKDGFGTVDGFVGLDEATKTRINLLMPTL